MHASDNSADHRKLRSVSTPVGGSVLDPSEVVAPAHLALGAGDGAQHDERVGVTVPALAARGAKRRSYGRHCPRRGALGRREIVHGPCNACHVDSWQADQTDNRLCGAFGLLAMRYGTRTTARRVPPRSSVECRLGPSDPPRGRRVAIENKSKPNLRTRRLPDEHRGQLSAIKSATGTAGECFSR
jgi:hypothetical protein